MSKPVIGFFGLTHLGIVSALAAAAKGFETIALDQDDALSRRLSRGEFDISEPGLQELWASAQPRIAFHGLLSKCDVVFLSRDTPLDDQSRPDHDQIRRNAALMPHLRKDAVLVVLSQVPPGFTRALEWPHEQLFCQVETLIYGRAVERALNPERIIVGTCQPSRYGSLRYIQQTYVDYLSAFGPGTLITMSYESAELAKIAINLTLIAQITATNTLAEICEKTGADWQEIVPALQSDPRIGSYLQPGLGLGGGHIERDLHTALALVGDHFLWGMVDNSDCRRNWLLEAIDSLEPPSHLAVLGLAYKVGTASMVNSPALVLFEGGDTLHVHDPVVPRPAQLQPGKDLNCVIVSHADPLDCLTDADALIIATPWPEYKSLTPEQLIERMSGRLVIDPHRVLDGRKLAEAGFEYHALGMRPLKVSTA